MGRSTPSKGGPRLEGALTASPPGEQAVRLGVEAPGVEREDAERAARQVSVVDESHVLRAGEGDGHLVTERLERLR